MITNILQSFVLLSSGLWGVGHQAPDSLELRRLEGVWNQAHLVGDTVALDSLWADELVLEVPGMARMSKAEVLGFWRSGRSNITRYSTSDLTIRIDGDSAEVTGRLLRERDFNGQVVQDDWRFTKTYRRINARWRVTMFRATSERDGDGPRTGTRL